MPHMEALSSPQSCKSSRLRCNKRILRSINKNTEPARCGEITLPHAARLYLHILRFFRGMPVFVEEAPKLQKIIHTKCRAAGGHAMKIVCGDYVRHVGQQGLKFPACVVIEDSILTPGEFPGDQFILGPTKRMKGMCNAESACRGSHTTCIR
jgi:hypothetical protein